MPPFIVNKLDIDVHEIADNVFELKRYWIPRSDEFGFYTLGRNAYLDGKTSAYYDEPKTLNPILLCKFGSLYQKVIRHLSEQFNEPIAVSDKLALPSFHIFESSIFLLTHAGVWHYDYPHITLGLGDIDPYTFTVAIKLPTGGAGLDYIDNEEYKYLEYKEGEIIGHDGKTLHRISSLKSCVPREYRITFQGHLIRINGILNMFW